MTDPNAIPRAAHHRRTALAVFGMAVVMLGLAYAAVPLYRVFCRATGYGGTPQVATAAPAARGARTLNVRFDANVAPGLPWKFEPETPEMTVRTGQTVTVFFKVRSTAARDTAANAQYNITPDIGGFYFNKIACFCFDEQHLGPNETAELPVVFFLDPKLEADPTMADVQSLTLSYTFFAAKAGATAAKAAANAAPDATPPRKL
ncbi:cytochrome c oxidase assembly protein [Lichenibacterium ramalinae]|uniref:cytochrome c oxidase assembly protein n=1 Tax=Lichenibacterium ramalinae TaxID=2316527 RepID=UPI001FE06A2B|nr:cytochrome c oxidase assembly protein [Lichenibacterium ramalinae]